MSWARRAIHEVERGSNLDLILRGFNGAINRFADQIGGGLQAIAIALATPKDNSGDVQSHLDALSKKLRDSESILQAAVNANKPK